MVLMTLDKLFQQETSSFNSLASLTFRTAFGLPNGFEAVVTSGAGIQQLLISTKAMSTMLLFRRFAFIIVNCLLFPGDHLMELRDRVVYDLGGVLSGRRNVNSEGTEEG